MRVSVAFCAAVVSACARPADHGASAPKTGHSEALSRAPASAASEAGTAEADAAAAVSEVAADTGALFPGTRFPPADVSPPHVRSRQPGDGEWQPLGSEEPALPSGTRVAYRMQLHPHSVSKWQRLTVVALDLEHVRVGYMPGVEDIEGLDALGGTAPPEGFVAGLVPRGEHDALLAVFNGGFKPRHGRWGLGVAGMTLLPAKQDGCTVTLDERGVANVGPWEQVVAEAATWVAFRQTPPCLVNAGQLHPLLQQHQARVWGGLDPKRKTRRRSAVGIDQSGRVLFYAIGEEMDPRVLAEGMRHVGAVSAAQLDINWSWTRFLLFGKAGEGQDGTDTATLRVSSSLIPQMVHQPREYIHKPAARDFFYVVERPRARESAP